MVSVVGELDLRGLRDLGGLCLGLRPLVAHTIAYCGLAISRNIHHELDGGVIKLGVIGVGAQDLPFTQAEEMFYYPHLDILILVITQRDLKIFF